MTRSVVLLALLILASTVLFAQWVPLGPDGGDARTITHDPKDADRILLGTSSGLLYESKDGGASWSRFARIGTNDYVLDNIEFDPADARNLYVAAWSVERQTDAGDLFRSSDGGKTWKALPFMHNKSIRAFTLAPSNPRTLLVGALDGVFRSDDGGDNWRQISPPNHAEIRNIESLAVDPKNPDIVYAGTWHLGWKTTDGGKTWGPMKNGVVDDSDVFSIIVDHTTPSTVYLSACSGIYKSENSADLFRKIQGIPFSARRTRVLQMDPSNHLVVYAGTTEGLWKTVDGGKLWKRISAQNIIVNDVMIDPRNSNRVLLATDRSGVLASNDAGATFSASNRGFSHRQVAAVVVDRTSPDTLYAGIVNDKEFGGVLVSRDGGSTWTNQNTGLNGRDVFTLKQTATGSIIAGTNRGVFELVRGGAQWRPINTVVRERTVTVKKATVKKGKKASAKPAVSTRTEVTTSELTARVTQIENSGAKWFAATSSGLFVSENDGKTWKAVEAAGPGTFVSVSTNQQTIVAATLRGAVVSSDGGETWTVAKVPTFLTAIFSTAVTPRSLWLATREGVWRSIDGGANWEHPINGVPARNIASVAYDNATGQVHVTSIGGELFSSEDNGKTWRRDAPEWTVRSVVPAGNRLLGLTAFEGIIAPKRASTRQPSGVTSGGGR